MYEPGTTGELIRIAVLGVGIVIGALPFWLPFFGDYGGFGGFPHRVWDEVGPGFAGLATWYKKGNDPRLRATRIRSSASRC